MKSSSGTINLDDQATAKFKNLKSSGGAINLDKDETPVKRRLRSKTKDSDNIFKAPSVPKQSVKRRLTEKKQQTMIIYLNHLMKHHQQKRHLHQTP